MRDERMPSWDAHKIIVFDIFGLRYDDIEKLYDPKGINSYVKKTFKVHQIIT